MSLNWMKSTVILVALLATAACDSPEERMENHYQSGIELLKSNDLAKAALEFRNVLQINTDHVPSLLGLSAVEEGNRNWRGVSNLLRKVLDLDPDNVEASTKIARLSLLARDLESALEYSNIASAAAPDDPTVLTVRAAILLTLDDAAGAIAAAERALEIDPGNAEAISTLAAEKIRSGDPQAAVRLLDQGLEIEEKEISLQLIKLRALEAMRDLPEIELLLEQLVELYPEASALRFALVRFYVQNEQQQEAEDLLRSAADASPTEIQAALDVVRFLNTYKSSEIAIQELETLVARNDDNRAGYALFLANLYYSQDQKDKSKQILVDLINTVDDEDQRFDVKSLLADFNLRNGDRDEARWIVSEILAEDGRNTNALLVRASLAVAEENYEDAIVDLRAVLGDTPDSVRALVLLGSAFERQGAMDLANEQYTRAFQITNYDGSVGIPLANFNIRRGDLTRAEDILLRVTQVNQRNLQAHRMLAQVRINQQDWIGAQESATFLRRLQDDEAVVNQIMGVALEGEKRFEQSIASFEAAQSAAPNQTRPLANLVGAYIRNEQADKAESFLKTVLETSPDNAFAKILLAKVYQVGGRMDEVEEQYKRIIEEHPEEDEAYASYISFLSAEQRPVEAKEVAAMARTARPDSVYLGLIKGTLLERDQDMDSALALYEELYNKDPTAVIVANNYASILTDYRTDAVSARRALEVSESFRNIDLPQFKDTRGWILYRLGRYEEALALFEETIESLDQLPVAHYHLGMAYRALGRFPEAKTALERALSVAGDNPFQHSQEIIEVLEELKS